MSFKVLVFGGGGLLGSSLVPYLGSIGHKVICVGRNLNKTDWTHKIIIDDYNDTTLINILDEYNPRFIINLSGLTNVDLCEKEPNEAFIANVSTVEVISNWVDKKEKKSNLIQISTDQVYDGKGPHEEGEVKLKNYYSFSKYAGELVALRSNSTILRTNFFGKSNCLSRKSFSDWALDALKNGNEIKAFKDVYFNPLTMFSLSKYIGMIIEKPLLGVFNLGSREGFSKADFIFNLARIFGFSTSNISTCSISEVNLTARRPRDMRMNCFKFEQNYNIELPTLEKEIELLKKEYKNYV
tara:strand:- start:12985 stop:13875 length:891 start_codon:yes stop_codon:yes gene_type:complete